MTKNQNTEVLTLLPEGYATTQWVINRWRTTDVLRADDQRLTSATLHQRLATAGLITKATGEWLPTEGGFQLGIEQFLRPYRQSGARRHMATRTTLGYPYVAVQAIKKLYLDGRI